MGKDQQISFETERLQLRPWRESDAEALYRWASDPQVGPIAGWAPHASVEESRRIIRTLFSAPETYAVVPKGSDEPIGCVGILFDSGMHTAALQADEAEIGFWIAVPYWGRGLIPEAVERLLRHCFDTLRLAAVWCGYYEGNERSRRVGEKCGFSYHHTEHDKLSPLGDRRTEHFTRLTRDAWQKR